MDCESALAAIGPYLDGELEATQNAAMERHIRDCPSWMRAFRGQADLIGAIRRGGSHFAAPEDLAARVVRGIAPAGSQACGPVVSWRSWLAGAAAAAVVLVAVFAIDPARFSGGASSADLLTQELVAGHVRSLLADHLTDVASSDQHTVKPWFDGRLDIAPPVRDFTAQGFQLVGGRLDYLAQREAAALVYRHRQHPINLFVWPLAKPEPAFPSETASRGYNILHWEAAGLGFWAVSDLDLDDLHSFQRLFGQEAPAGS